MTIDFDKDIDREHSHSLKFDARKAYFGRADVLPMWVADMDFAAPQAVTDALIARAEHPIYGYTLFPDSMYAALIDWCQRRYDWTVQQQQVLMCPGVVPSIHAAIEALTEPGDKVVVQPPVYFPFFSAVTQTRRELVLNPLKREGLSYQMDLEHLESCAKAGAKMLVLCSPHNPVGRVWTEQELRDLLSITEKYQMIVLSDEIHADLIFPGQTHIPLAKLVQEDKNVVTAIAPSKTFNIPGMGLSALVVGDKQKRKAINTVFDSWHVSAANPFSITAFEAAYRGGEAWLDALMPYLADSRAWVDEFMQQTPGIRLTPSQGTYLLWFDCRQLAMDNQTLRQFFIEQAGVGMNPGFVFGDEGGGFMRMNIGTPRYRVQQAMQQIAEALRRTEKY